MYRFDKIESLAMMKNVCLYIRIYNEMKASENEKLDLVVRDYIRAKYNKDIPLFDLAELRRLAKSFTKEGNIPSLLQLDEIISIYIKDVEKKAKGLSMSIKEAVNEYENVKRSTKDGVVYTSKELSLLEGPIAKQLKNNFLVLILGSLLIGVAMLAISYPLLSKLNIDLTNILIKNKTIALFLPVLTGSIFVGFIILWLVLKKNIKRLFYVSVLINANIGKIKRLENFISKTKQELDLFLAELKLVKINGEKITGLDKLNYLLRIDNKFVSEAKTKKETKKAEKHEAATPKINETKLKDLEFDGWAKATTASMEKKNCNVDLLARIGLITDSIKANNQTDSPEFSDVIKIYCEELSGENREKMIVKSTNQIGMYKFYIDMVGKLEPYEKLCKEKLGLDYDGEKYSYRVANDEEKEALINYAFSIIENHLSSSYFADKFKEKVYTKYNTFKVDVSHAVKRVDMYKLYIDFLEDLKSRIKNYIR